MVKKITENEFKQETENGIAVVDFSAQWCGPCHMMEPVLEQISEELEGKMKFFNVDIDENMELAKTYGVMSVPTLMLFKDGNMVSKKIGFMPKELITSWVEENK